MRRGLAAVVLAVALAAGTAAAAEEAPPPAVAVPTQSADPAVARGAYLFAVADCAGCHTDRKNKGAPLAGGRPLPTAFGTFYGPNITPDPQHGIGGWSEADFRRALRQGRGRHNEFLFPAFPFASFTGLSDQDISDLYAYVMAQPPSPQPDQPHQLRFPFNLRILLAGWRMLFFTQGPLAPAAGQSAEWNRGRYLAEAVAHCQECHTPRNFLGGLDRKHAYAGNDHGPDGQHAPNISSDPKDGIGVWSIEEIETLLKTGQTPEFDTVGAGMGDVVAGTGQLTDADRHAIAVFLKSVPPQTGAGG